MRTVPLVLCLLLGILSAAVSPPALPQTFADGPQLECEACPLAPLPVPVDRSVLAKRLVDTARASDLAGEWKQAKLAVADAPGKSCDSWLVSGRPRTDSGTGIVTGHGHPRTPPDAPNAQS
jgi:hypothetical protein